MKFFLFKTQLYKEVKNKIASLSDADYTFVVFSGNGFMNKRFFLQNCGKRQFGVFRGKKTQ